MFTVQIRDGGRWYNNRRFDDLNLAIFYCDGIAEMTRVALTSTGEIMFRSY